MSVELMYRVWDSDLPSDEKFVALTLASWADDYGRSIHPSQAHIAWKVGKTDRSVRDTLRKLIERGVFVKVSGAGGGRTVVHYRLDAEALPTREPYKRPENISGVDDAPRNPTSGHPGNIFRAPRKPTSDDPSSDPSSDPSLLDSDARARARTPEPEERLTSEAQRLTIQAARDAILGATNRRGNATQRRRVELLVRKGATVTDFLAALETAKSAPRDDVVSYALGCVAGSLEDRQNGVTRTSTRNGSAVRSAGAGTDRKGDWRDGDRGDGFSRNNPHRKVRIPDNIKKGIDEEARRIAEQLAGLAADDRERFIDEALAEHEYAVYVKRSIAESV